MFWIIPVTWNEKKLLISLESFFIVCLCFLSVTMFPRILALLTETFFEHQILQNIVYELFSLKCEEII